MQNDCSYHKLRKRSEVSITTEGRTHVGNDGLAAAVFFENDDIKNITRAVALKVKTFSSLFLVIRRLSRARTLVLLEEWIDENVQRGVTGVQPKAS